MKHKTFAWMVASRFSGVAAGDLHSPWTPRMRSPPRLRPPERLFSPRSHQANRPWSARSWGVVAPPQELGLAPIHNGATEYSDVAMRERARRSAQRVARNVPSILQRAAEIQACKQAFFRHRRICPQFYPAEAHAIKEGSAWLLQGSRPTPASAPTSPASTPRRLVASPRHRDAPEMSAMRLNAPCTLVTLGDAWVQRQLGPSGGVAVARGSGSGPKPRQIVIDSRRGRQS